MKNRDKTFLFYQSIGLIPLDAKRSDWHLHHMDTTLKYRDPERYKQYNPYDVIPLPTRVHTHVHSAGENSSFYGKHHTDETKAKISQSKTNPSEETRRRISESRQGMILSEDHKRNIGEGVRKRNSLRTEEEKKKISESHKGNKSTTDYRWYKDELTGKRIYYR